MPAVALIGVLAIPSTAFAGGWIPYHNWSNSCGYGVIEMNQTKSYASSRPSKYRCRAEATAVQEYHKNFAVSEDTQQVAIAQLYGNPSQDGDDAYATAFYMK